jgi:hypothetical protein
MKTSAFRSVSASSFAQALRPALLGLVTLLGSAFAPALAAESKPGVELTQVNANSLRVRAYSPDLKPIRVQVLHVRKGAYVLNETHRQAAYGTLLKFNTLPAGRYVVYLKAGKTRRSYAVQVTGNTADANTVTLQKGSTRSEPKTNTTASL